MSTSLADILKVLEGFSGFGFFFFFFELSSESAFLVHVNGTFNPKIR